MSALSLRPVLALRLLLAFAVVGMLDEVAIAVFVQPRFESDTDLVVAAAESALGCLRAGAGGRCEGLSRFPLMQHLPALAMLAAGAGRLAVLRGLSLLSVASQAAIVAVLARDLRRAGPGLADLGVAAWVGSFGVWYLASTFAEPLAAFVTLAAVLSSHRRWPVATALAAAVAVTSKEVAAPFVVALGALALKLSDPSPAPSGRGRVTFAALLLGVALGVAANLGFNLWRFGSIINAGYLDPRYRAGPYDAALHLLGLWVSPNGGLVWFAPVVVAAVVAASLAPRRAPDDAGPLVARGALAVMAVITVGFARWYAPMGWWAWGPRYLLPWVPAVLWLALRARGDAWTQRAAAASPWRYAAVAVALAALALPNALSTLDSVQYNRFFMQNPECGYDTVWHDAVAFARITRCMLFPRRAFWWLWLAPDVLRKPVFSASYVVLVATLLWRARPVSTTPRG